MGFVLRPVITRASMLSFGSVSCVNNILELKGMSTFLVNYNIQEKPTWFQRYLIKKALSWIDWQAKRNFVELRGLLNTEQISLGLKDCDSGLFTVLFLAKAPKFVFKTGKELFDAIASFQLDFEKVKRPREEIKVG